MKRIHQLRFFFFFLSLFFILFFSCSCISSAFQSDELLQDDDEFEGVRSPDFGHLNPKSSPITRKQSSSDPDSSSISSDSKVRFSLDHAFGDGSDFSPAGTFTARIKTLNHGGQVLPSPSLPISFDLDLIRFCSVSCFFFCADCCFLFQFWCFR